MQIVIDIHEKDYQTIKNGHIPFSILDAIMKGIPLPKGHGRLIDADERRTEIDEEDRWVVDLAETIIEADKEVDGCQDGFL